ncbi:hypothetical protein PF005_g8114 [Phytophthora fragariae]|uniref:BED-type domain-containing protein n=2 Tax=Phytophthora fragariae TaxID=53985 RepID=A0A6A3LHS7_9STRA|nr:hypothetical protein PF011_g6391 [Phytophthora fragariae]KAE9218833.1 hypothetical protein PF005_g8114 [Phytophthora fragariae]KAE9242764.1 hypothetical protein PF004_g6479 [Phytophthora fragariae]
MVGNKQLAAFFYTLHGQGLFRCNLCGSERKQLAGSDYSNLMAHLASKHAGYEATGGDPSPQWIRWVIERNMPVHEVEDALTRSISKLRPVTAKAIKKCTEGIAIEVGQKLGKEMGPLFALMFDGWSHAGIHYVALYAVYETDGKLRVPMFGLLPLEDGSQTADAHIKLFGNMLDVNE